MYLWVYPKTQNPEKEFEQTMVDYLSARCKGLRNESLVFGGLECPRTFRGSDSSPKGEQFMSDTYAQLLPPQPSGQDTKRS